MKFKIIGITGSKGVLGRQIKKKNQMCYSIILMAIFQKKKILGTG